MIYWENTVLVKFGAIAECNPHQHIAAKFEFKSCLWTWCKAVLFSGVPWVSGAQGKK